MRNGIRSARPIMTRLLSARVHVQAAILARVTRRTPTLVSIDQVHTDLTGRALYVLTIVDVNLTSFPLESHQTLAFVIVFVRRGYARAVVSARDQFADVVGFLANDAHPLISAVAVKTIDSIDASGSIQARV